MSDKLKDREYEIIDTCLGYVLSQLNEICKTVKGNCEICPLCDPSIGDSYENGCKKKAIEESKELNYFNSTE